MHKIEDMYLSAEGAADVNQLIAEAAREGRSGAIGYYLESQRLAWCGMVVEGALVGQLTTVAQSAEDAQLVAASMSQVVGASLAASRASAEAIRKIQSGGLH